MAYREMTAWITLAADVFVWGPYFWRLVYGPARSSDALLEDFAGCVVLAIAVQVALTIVAALRAPSEAEAPADERERLIDLRATRTAFTALTITTLATAVACFVSGDPVLVSSVAIGGLILADVVRSAHQILAYRLAA